MTWTREDGLTYALQAQGPDEFPTGYYRYLAQQILAEEEDDDA